MRGFKKILAALGLILALALPGLTQTATTTTSLSQAVSSASATRIVVASATGFAAGNICYLNREAMRINAVTGTNIDVMRGQYQTKAAAHPAYSTIWVGPAGGASPFRFDDPNEGSAVTASTQSYLPQINVRNGKLWSVVGSTWMEGNNFTVTTNYGLSPAIWSDCPLDKMIKDPAYGVYDGDDFSGSSGSPVTTLHKYTFSGANGTFTQVAAIPGGAWILTAPGTDNDEIYVHANNAAGLIKADAASNWWFEARVKINQITTAQGVFVGLHEENSNAVTNMTDNTMALAVLDFLGFQVIQATDAAAIWQTVFALNGGARVAVSATAGTATAAYTKLGMKSVAGTVTFYIDGSPLATGTTSAATNFPLNQIMSAAFMSKCGSAAANTLTIDWWKAAQTRLAN